MHPWTCRTILVLETFLFGAASGGGGGGGHTLRVLRLLQWALRRH